MTFLEFGFLFPTKKSVIDYFVELRFGTQPHCIHCGSSKVYQKNGDSQSRFFHCNNCSTEFSIFHGMIFYNSQTNLRKWFFAINTILLAKKDISALQLQRKIGCTYKTAWRMLNLLLRQPHGILDRKDMSVKHMQNYLNEFCFRQNNLNKDSDDVFELLVRQCILAA